MGFSVIHKPNKSHLQNDKLFISVLNAQDIGKGFSFFVKTKH